MRYLPFLALILTGCAHNPVCPPSPVVTVTETERVPVPLWLTEPCSVECEIVTNGDLLECYHRQRAALVECDARMDEIRGLE